MWVCMWVCLWSASMWLATVVLTHLQDKSSPKAHVNQVIIKLKGEMSQLLVFPQLGLQGL